MLKETRAEIERIYLAASELEAGEQKAYLDRMCGRDDALRREVELLLEFLETVPSQAPDKPVGSGTQIGPYTVVGFLRAGGMGEVYQARDTRLERSVAIKFLPTVLAGDAAALDRFRREARAASALNHPHICTVHDIGDHNGRPFFVMELLEGQSLNEHLAGKAMAVSELVPLAVQICDALRAAHAKGIIHRDIKPANIFVLKNGQIKVLDFGLAKLVEERHSAAIAAAVTESGISSRAATRTRPGRLMGTPAYLSPEQARGEEVDVRTDIFSCGLVLYEMATGRPTFRGQTSGELINAILRETPVKPSMLNPAVPGRLERIILKALEKDRNTRYQSAEELLADLSEFHRAKQRFAMWTSRIALAAAILAIGVALVIGIVSNRRHLQPTPVVSRYVEITADSEGKTASYVNEVPSPLVSDGSRLFFMEGPLGSKKLAQVPIGGGEVTRFLAPIRIRRPVDISPDRRDLLVLSSDEPLEKEVPLMVVPLPGGSPHRIGDLLAHDASYSPDGLRIAYASGHELYVAKADGSEARKLATLAGTAWWPRWSPDSSVLRFTVQETGNWRKLWEVAANGSRLHRLFPDHVDPASQCCGSWTQDGRYFVFASSYYSNSQLWAIRERGGSLNKTQELTQLTTGPINVFAPLPNVSRERLFAVAVQQRGQLVRYDSRSGQFVPFLAGISADGVDFSKDGQWATYVALPGKTLWRSRVDGGERLQLTFPPMEVSFLPRWSPDGKRIAFVARSAIGKPLKIYLISADGGSPAQAIPGELNEGDPSWSPDGNTLAFAPLFWVDGRSGIRLLDLRTRQLTPLSGSDGLFSPHWSPDGRYIAALTADPASTLVLFDLETHKRVELYNRLAYPNWSRDGHYVYFDDPYSDEPALYRVRTSDGKVEKITTLDPSVLRWAIVGKWTGLAPDDSPLVLRDTSIEEIYALDWKER